MKKFLSILVLVFAITSLYAQDTQEAEKKDGPEVTLETEVYDFGKIKKEEKLITHKFKLTNTGNKPLILQRVVTGCGCASATATQAPILPNEEGEIILSYETTSVGKFNRRITIFSNAGNPKILTITGEIE